MTGSFHEEEALGKAEDLRQIRRLLRYLRPYRGTVALAILLLLGIAALQLVGPWLTMVALDRAIPAGDTRLLGLLAVGFAASLGLSFLFE